MRTVAGDMDGSICTASSHSALVSGRQTIQVCRVAADVRPMSMVVRGIRLVGIVLAHWQTGPSWRTAWVRQRAVEAAIELAQRRNSMKMIQPNCRVQFAAEDIEF